MTKHLFFLKINDECLCIQLFFQHLFILHRDIFSVYYTKKKLKKLERKKIALHQTIFNLKINYLLGQFC